MHMTNLQSAHTYTYVHTSCVHLYTLLMYTLMYTFHAHTYVYGPCIPLCTHLMHTLM